MAIGVPVMKTYAPSFTNAFALARPMPLFPPVTSVIFPSILFRYSSRLIQGCQNVRATIGSVNEVEDHWVSGQPPASLRQVPCKVAPGFGTRCLEPALEQAQR